MYTISGKGWLTMGTMNKILALIGITALIFISVCFVFAWKSKTVPDSLIMGFFGAIGAEGFIMGWIKNVKQKKGSSVDE